MAKDVDEFAAALLHANRGQPRHAAAKGAHSGKPAMKKKMGKMPPMKKKASR